MRRFKPTRWIPEDSIERKHPEELGVVYLYTSPKGLPGAVAYGGKRTKPDWHFTFFREEQREQKTTDYFQGLTASAEFKAERRKQIAAERRRDRAALPASEGNASQSYSLAGTAQCVRNVLAEVFPRTQFSVRSKSYSGGCSIRVYWTDGPTQNQVMPILDAFESADFDGMQDLKTYRQPTEWRGKRVKFHGDYIQPARTLSNELTQRAADVVGEQVGARLTVEPNGNIVGGPNHVPYQWYPHYEDGPVTLLDRVQLASDPTQGEWLSTLVWRVANAVSLEAAAVEPDLPRPITDDYINRKVEELLL